MSDRSLEAGRDRGEWERGSATFVGEPRGVLEVGGLDFLEQSGHGVLVEG